MHYNASNANELVMVHKILTTSQDVLCSGNHTANCLKTPNAPLTCCNYSNTAIDRECSYLLKHKTPSNTKSAIKHRVQITINPLVETKITPLLQPPANI